MTNRIPSLPVARTKHTPEDAKNLIKALSRRGPHRVLRGDLALAGLPGVVLTPEEGLGLPAVAFGHEWLQPVSRYLGTLQHLASWGIVAAAPATQRGPVPSHLKMAADLATALEICSSVRLGPGEISVQPDRLAVAGHGMGAGAAVLAARRNPALKAVAGFAPADTSPSAVQAAQDCRAPALLLSTPRDEKTPGDSDAERIARAWAGPVSLREVAKANDLGLTEGWHWTNPVIDGRPERKTQALVRALFTGFLLATLTGDDRYAELASPEAVLPGARVVDLTAEKDEQHHAPSIGNLISAARS